MFTDRITTRTQAKSIAKIAQEVKQIQIKISIDGKTYVGTLTEENC